MTAAIVGWAHTPFGKLETDTVESLIVRVATDALADAGIAPGDVDEIFLGHFNAGFSPQDFTAALVLQASPALRFKPATRVENACATGSAAVHQAIRTIQSGAGRVVPQHRGTSSWDYSHPGPCRPIDPSVVVQLTTHHPWCSQPLPYATLPPPARCAHRPSQGRPCPDGACLSPRVSTPPVCPGSALGVAAARFG